MLDRKEKALWEISFASDEDIPGWMELVRLVIDGFPHLNEEEYIRVLRQKISTGQALIMKDRGSAIGIMLFSYENGSIDFMGSHPLYRKKGVPKAMLDKVMKELLKGKEISITTYREGDKADTGYRKEIKGLGFAEAELLVEYGYPTQRFILQQEERSMSDYSAIPFPDELVHLEQVSARLSQRALQRAEASVSRADRGVYGYQEIHGGPQGEK